MKPSPISILLLVLLCALLLPLASCTVQRNSDGTTAAGVQVTASDVLAAWDRYEARKVRAEK